MNGERPVLAISIGDPAGIGPEVTIKALQDPAVVERCRPLLIGDEGVLRRAAEICGIEPRWTVVADPLAVHSWTDGCARILHQPARSEGLPAFGELAAVNGVAAVRAVETAIDLTLAGTAAAMVTAPLNKEAMRLAGYDYDGHTELLAMRTGASNVCMMLAGERLRVAHVTGHRSLRAAATCPSPDRLLQVIDLTWRVVRGMGISRPRVAVAGLNPHAGESGLFGDDEVEVIGPAVARACAATSGAEISGPYPPDTVFRRAATGEFDAVVAMYHDQGHIPVKLIEFETAVNVTLGLPIIRTSPDHGTAFDIAGRGIANPTNMTAAIVLAAKMAVAREAAIAR